MGSNSEIIEVEIKRSNLVAELSSPVLESLPRDLILCILSRLPVSSFVQLRSVCTGWCMLARDPDLVNKYRSCMDEINNPCLIFHSDCTIKNQLHFVEFPDCNHESKEKAKRFHVPFWEVMPEFDVLGSYNGLLCLSDSLQNDALCVCNPFTGNYQDLPKSTLFLNQQVVYGFGFHPTTKEYKVLKIVYYMNSNKDYLRALRVYVELDSEVQIFTLGSSTWRSLGKVGYLHHLYQWHSQVLVNGRLHWVTWPRRYHHGIKIISFDLAEEQFLEVPSTPLMGFNYHLVVLGGCLFAAVYFNYCKLEIWVMAEYGVEESWIKKFDIRAHMPKGLKEDPANQFFKNSKIIWKGGYIRVLCLLKNGDILLEYKNRALVSYGPKSGEFKDVIFQGMPKWYQTIVHVGSLTWIDTTLISTGA
ncbi:hypothetical protein F2P56_001704 [Juglans regia]|uniref:F-box protein At3g07870-like n=2 Tax=Juglans regia TaxID=51240 RepID=A0A2I4FT04_JUGRE|nr:F-box protein At3g07870-like [Juglans regia]KAF5481008.1 hypothetical protein F2P56_001704 [Juglans regia]